MSKKPKTVSTQDPKKVLGNLKVVTPVKIDPNLADLGPAGKVPVIKK